MLTLSTNLPDWDTTSENSKNPISAIENTGIWHHNIINNPKLFSQHENFIYFHEMLRGGEVESLNVGVDIQKGLYQECKQRTLHLKALLCGQTKAIFQSMTSYIKAEWYLSILPASMTTYYGQRIQCLQWCDVSIRISVFLHPLNASD